MLAQGEIWKSIEKHDGIEFGRSKWKEATRYNLRRRPIKFKIGDRVLKIATRLSDKADSKAGKLYDKYECPYIIKRKIFPTVYELKNLKGKSIGEWNIYDFKLESISINRNI